MANKLAYCVKRRSAFTLFELLTVLAVIGVLTALLLAGLSSAKGKAQQAKCGSNVNQLGNALQQFVGDYHVYPRWLNTKFRDPNDPYFATGQSWKAALETVLFPGYPKARSTYEGLPLYIDDESGVWSCPAAQRPSAWPKDRPFQDYGYNALGIYVPFNGTPLGLGGQNYPWTDLLTSTPVEPVREGQVAAPSDMIALGDRFAGNDGVVTDASGLARQSSITEGYYPGSTKHAWNRHQGKAEIVFCDGHVESVSLNKLFKDTSDAAMRRWNRDDQPHSNSLTRDRSYADAH